MLKILQAGLQHYVNCELPDVQAGFRKGRGTRNQIANIHSIIEKARELQKNMYFCFIDNAKAFHCVDHNKLKNSWDGNTWPSDLRNLDAGREATGRTGHGTTDWFQIQKGVEGQTKRATFPLGAIATSCLVPSSQDYHLGFSGLSDSCFGDRF